MEPLPGHATEFQALFLRTLGAPFVAFVLGFPPSEAPKDLPFSERLSQVQRSILHELVTYVATLESTLPPDQRGNLRFFLSDLFRFRPDLGMSWAAHARQRTAGATELIPVGDDVLESITILLRDHYAAFLLPIDEPSMGFGRTPITAPSLYQHPESKTFATRVMRDASLARLFPTADESGPSGFYCSSVGRAGGIQLALFSTLLLESSWRAAHRHASYPSPEAVAEELRRTVCVLRRAIAGRPATVHARMGLAGVRLHEGQGLTLPDSARVRAITSADREFIPRGLSGKLSGMTPEGRAVQIDYAGDLVLEMEVPYQIKVLQDLGFDSGFPIPLRSHEALTTTFQNLHLGLVLSVEDSRLPSLLRTWTVVHDPLDYSGVSWSDPRQAPRLSPTFVGWQQARLWRMWTSRVAKSRKASIDVAIRRILSAASNRTDAADALIDLVIAWENLFGSGRGEVTLRVSAAIAWLLESEPAAREAKRAQVSKLYSLRSKVVHGSTPPEPAAAAAALAEAQEVTVSALRALFGDRRALLANARDSTDLGVRLMMGV
jgi:hypothetical protein